MTALSIRTSAPYRGTFNEVSNREDWIIDIEIVEDTDDEDAVDISEATITFEVQDGLCQKLLATTGNGKVTFPNGGTDGLFRVSFPYTEMDDLAEKNYEVGCVITLDGVRRQLLVVTVPIVEGHIS